MFAVHTPTQSLIIKAEDPFKIRGLIPNSKTLDHDGYNVVVKHTLDATRLLRNIGIDAPLPPYHWPGKYTPFSHQRVMTDFQATHQKCFNLSDPGTMKTAATLWAADILMKERVIEKAIIFTTLSTMKSIWEQAIFDVLMHRRAVIVHGSREHRAKMMSQNVDFYICNHDGVTIDEVRKAVRKRTDIGLVIVDEGSLFRNHDTDKYRFLLGMLQPRHWVWWLTGGPTPQAPTDAWAQASIINPAATPKFFGTFKRETMQEVSKFRWVAKAGATARVYEILQPAVRFKKSDCVDLPPVVTINVSCELTPAQKTMAKSMKDDMVALWKAKQINAVNAADKLGKLRQIFCGSVKEDTTPPRYIKLPHAPRYAAMKEAIDGAASKSIVIVPYKGIIQALHRELESDRLTVGVLNGDVPLRERERIITDFKTLDNPQVLLCHPKVMAHGLNLTEADTMIFFAPITSADEYNQVIERFNRVGQTLKMTIIRIGAHPIEWQLYKMLDNRMSSQNDLLELYRQVVES